MGRHGGGSRSGGSRSSSRRSGGSRRSGSSSSSSNTYVSHNPRAGYSYERPFKGCYNRSYRRSNGEYVTYYTSDKDFTKSKTSRIMTRVFSLVACVISLIVGIFLFFDMCIVGNKKVHGYEHRIEVIDTIDCIPDSKEEDLLNLCKQIYDKSGMPVTIYTEQLNILDNYTGIEARSEELYYKYGPDESGMIILYTEGYNGDFLDWNYDVYAGDSTYDCLSDRYFDGFLKQIYKNRVRVDVYDALVTSLNYLEDNICKPYVNLLSLIEGVLPCLIIFVFFGLLPFLGSFEKTEMEKYFDENPDELSNEKIMVALKCESCGAPNTNKENICPYCGSVLELRE